MSAADSDDTSCPATTELPPSPIVTQRNDSMLKRSSAEVSIMMMLRIPPTSPPPPPLSVSSPPASTSSSLPHLLYSPSASPASCVPTIKQVASRGTPQMNPSTNISASTATKTPKTATATTASTTTSPSASSSTGIATKTTMMMTMMSPPTSSARRSTASVQSWFQAELDTRGIESVYSRYIISLLLQQDNYHCSADGDLASSPECTHGIGGAMDITASSHNHQHQHHHRQCTTANNNNNNNGDQNRNTASVDNKNVLSQGNKWSSGGGNGIGGAGNGRRHRSTGRRDRQQPLSAEQRKKKEAVRCLLEICDDILSGDIEDLIEELMVRLKQVDNEMSSTTQPVILPPANNNNNNLVPDNTSRQDPAEQYYAAFPALSGDTRMPSQTQSSQVSLISVTDVSNVWKRKQQQQQSKKSSAILSTQTDKSIIAESTPPRSRQNNAASRRRRGCLSHHGNKENLHKPPFTLRSRDDRGNRYGSHSNKLRGGRGRSSRSVVPDMRQKYSHSFYQQNSRNAGSRRHGGGGGGGGVGGGPAPTPNERKYCLNVEHILKEILRSTNNSSIEENVSHGWDPSNPYNLPGHFCVPKIESSLKALQPWSNEGSTFKKMSLNLTGKGFEENSAWYDISFLETHLSSSDMGARMIFPPSLLMSGGVPENDERSYVRLYKRHSYLPPSPRSMLTLDEFEEKEVLKKFSACIGPRTNMDPKQKLVVSACVSNTIKQLPPDGTDSNMYAATENVVDSSVRSLLDCSPEEILPSSARSPSNELERSLQLLSGYPLGNDIEGCRKGSKTSNGTFSPKTANLSPYGWSSPVKALSPSGIVSPSTPVSSPSSTTSLSLLDVSYLTNMADREKGSPDKNQAENSKISGSNPHLEHLFQDKLSNCITDLSSLFDSPTKFVAEITASTRSNFTHDPYMLAWNTLTDDDDDDEVFDLDMTPTPAHGAIGQALYSSTTYRPWSYAIMEDRIISEVQTSEFLSQNEHFYHVWDVNFQRRGVIPSNQNCHSHTNFNCPQHSPKLDASPSFLLQSTYYEMSSPRVTPFTFSFSSVFNSLTPSIDDCGAYQKSMLGNEDKLLSAILSGTDSIQETSFIDSVNTSSEDPKQLRACLKIGHRLEDSYPASPSSPPNVKLALTMTTTVLSSSHSAISSASSGTSSSSSSPFFQEPLPAKEPTHKYSLIPSANSAFASVVPNKNKTKNKNIVTEKREDKGITRLVNPSVSPHETLYFSPKTHFQPIRSPLPMADTLELSLSESVTTGMNTLVKTSDLVVAPPCLYQPPDLFGGHTTSRSPYQQFKPETNSEDGEENLASFVPSFKILKNHDKFVQTGSLEENLDIDLEKLADDVCSEIAKLHPVPKSSILYCDDSGHQMDHFASVWNQSDSLWPQDELVKDPKSSYHSAWNMDRPSAWTPVKSADKWTSTFSSPSSSLDHRPYVFARDSVWYTTAGTLSAVRDDAWLSSSSGTPNSGLSTPCTTSSDSQTRINVVCKTKIKKSSSPTEATCDSPNVEKESVNTKESIWSSSWTVSSTTPVYSRVVNKWDADEGHRESVTEEETCIFSNPEKNPTLLTPETLTKACSSQSVWPNKIWEPRGYDISPDETLSIGLKSAVSTTSSSMLKEAPLSDKETEISTEEELVQENQDGSCSRRFDSTNIWAVPNATMWSLPILTHSSSSSTSASLAASPSSVPSPPLTSLSHPPTSSDPLLDLVCGPTCAQTLGASKPCQHQQIRKIWEHMDPQTNNSNHGEHGVKKENRKSSPYQVYGANGNRPPLMSNIQAKNQEPHPFCITRPLANVLVTSPGVSNPGSNHKKPISKTLSLGPTPMLPISAYYSSELEKQWLDAESNCSSSASSVQRTKMQREKQWPCKPCSYFLEGKCRREQCKYTHDVCSITCRFWKDGDCFKGHTCPFLHGYLGETVQPSMDSSFIRKAETSPSFAATIHTSSITHPSAPPEKFEKECRSLTQSKAQMLDRISTGKADLQDDGVLTLNATDVFGLWSETKTIITEEHSSRSDTLPDTTASSGSNRSGSEAEGVSLTAPTSLSPPPPPLPPPSTR